MFQSNSKSLNSFHPKQTQKSNMMFLQVIKDGANIVTVIKLLMSYWSKFVTNVSLFLIKFVYLNSKKPWILSWTLNIFWHCLIFYFAGQHVEGKHAWHLFICCRCKVYYKYHSDLVKSATKFHFKTYLNLNLHLKTLYYTIIRNMYLLAWNAFFFFFLQINNLDEWCQEKPISFKDHTFWFFFKVPK